MEKFHKFNEFKCYTIVRTGHNSAACRYLANFSDNTLSLARPLFQHDNNLRTTPRHESSYGVEIQTQQQKRARPLNWAVSVIRVRLKPDGTRWRREGKWRGNWRMEWVASILTLPRNMVYPVLLTLMRTPRLPAVDWNDDPRRFKWTRLFRRKTKSGFCACAITFQTQSTQLGGDQISKRKKVYATETTGSNNNDSIQNCHT